MRRRLLLAGVTVVALAVAIPLSVLITVAAGVPARHWSGAHLDAIRWDGDGYVGTQAAEGTYSYPPDLVDRVTDDLLALSKGGPLWTQTAPDNIHDCVSAVVVRLDNHVFDVLGRHYGDAVCIIFSPNEVFASPAGGGASADGASLGSWSDLPGDYWVLLTGFPLHIATMLLLFALAWTVPSLVRLRRGARRPPPPPPAPEADPTAA